MYINRYKNSSNDVRVEKVQELMGDISQILVQLINDFGLDRMSKEDYEQDGLRTVELIMKHYPDFSLRDLRDAFEMAVIHAIPDLKPSDYNMFGKLRPEFVCNVLNSYRKHYLIKKKQEEKARIDLENSKVLSAYNDNRLKVDAVNYTLEQYTLFLNDSEKHVWEDWGYIIFNSLSELGFVGCDDDKMEKYRVSAVNELMGELARERSTCIITGQNLQGASIASTISSIRHKHIDKEKGAVNYINEETKIKSKINLFLVKDAFADLKEENITPEQLKTKE